MNAPQRPPTDQQVSATASAAAGPARPGEQLIQHYVRYRPHQQTGVLAAINDPRTRATTSK